MYKVVNRWNHQDTIKIEWNLTKRCNYDCSYCPSEIHDNTSKPVDIEILKGTIDKLSVLGKPIRLSFTGGEPTVHPKFEQLISYARQKGILWISVTTNGTRKSTWYAKQDVNQWVFSLHFEYHVDRILHTLYKINEEKPSSMSLLVNVMAHHDYMKTVMSSTERLSFYNIPYVVRRIRWTQGNRDLFDDLRYNTVDLDWIKQTESTVSPNTVISYIDRPDEQLHANDVIKLHLNQYNGWSCNAGIESLMINWDGEVHRATCRVGGSLGNIYNDTFTVPSEPVICNRNFCTCAADIPLTKLKI